MLTIDDTSIRLREYLKNIDSFIDCLAALVARINIGVAFATRCIVC